MNEREIQAINSKEKIMKVAIEEFALNGYKGASTNNVCKNAKISKGLLYHYYSSKENLYLSVLEYTINKFKKNIKIDIEDSSKKGVDYISEYFNAKFRFFSENPLYSKVIINSLLNDNIEQAKELGEEFENYNNTLIYDVIKSIELNPKFDKEKAFELIVIIGEKLEEKHMKTIGFKSEETAIEEFRKDHKIMIEMVFEGIDK